MAWIKTLSLAEATGRLKTEYEASLKRAGRVWNIVRLMSLNPRILKSSMALYKDVMKGSSELTRIQRELVATVVSKTNGCFY